MRLHPRTHKVPSILFDLFLALLFLAALAGAAESIDLIWDANTENDIAGYRVLYGTASGTYSDELMVGISPTATLAGLIPGVTYFCAVQAVNTEALRSPLSEEISFTIPSAPDPRISVEQAAAPLPGDGGSTVDFGDVPLPSTGSLSLTIRNLGTSDLAGIAITIDGSHPGDFLIENAPASAVAPGSSSDFNITFKPTAGGKRSATLHIASNDAANSPFSLRITGNAVPVAEVPAVEVPGPPIDDAQIPSPKIAVALDGAIVVASGAAPATFGNVHLGETSLTRTFTIRNTGTVTVTGLQVMQNGPAASDFILEALPQSTLAPGDSTGVRVSFRPATIGNRDATLSLVSDRHSESVFTLALTGTGTAVPKIAVSSSSGPFEAEVIGTTSDARIYTIRNEGKAQLTHLALSVTGADASDYQTGSLSKTTLAPGASTTFKLFFTPSAAGPRDATLRIASNDPVANPLTIPLDGTGLPAPEISIKLGDRRNLTDEAAFINFGPVTRSASGARRTITITNRGSARLTGLSLQKNGLNNPDFTTSKLRTTTLAPGASTTLVLTFKPTTTGIRWCAIHLSSNDADERVFDIVLTGRGESAAASKNPSPLPAASLPNTGIRLVRGTAVSGARKYRTLTAVWPAGQRDMSRRIEVSSDLLTWSSGAKHTTILHSDATRLTVRDNTPVTRDGKRHIRLQK